MNSMKNSKYYIKSRVKLNLIENLEIELLEKSNNLGYDQ